MNIIIILAFLKNLILHVSVTFFFIAFWLNIKYDGQQLNACIDRIP